jgi:hypothetical protein
MPKRIIRRRGPLSNKEKNSIKEWIDQKDDKEIARLLNRTPAQIFKFKREYLAGAPQITVNRTEAEEYLRELHAHSSWTSLQKQFTTEELIFFENDFIEYRKQFKDMTATETKQLHQMITLDIFMQRHNIDRIQNQEEIGRMEKILKKKYNEDTSFQSPQDIQYIQHLEIQIQGARVANVNRTKEYKDLLEKHQAIMKDLKGTRMQRIKDIQDSGKFMGILKELELEESRSNLGEITGLMDLAIEKEKARLAAPHIYMDNIVDQPVLNCETVMDLGD